MTVKCYQYSCDYIHVDHQLYSTKSHYFKQSKVESPIIAEHYIHKITVINEIDSYALTI